MSSKSKITGASQDEGNQRQKGKDNPSVSKRNHSEMAGQSADMGAHRRLIHDMSGLFIAELRDVYWAERALEKALPEIARKAMSQELSHAISDHLEQTKSHTVRLERVFSVMGEKPQGEKCDAMEGLITETEKTVDRIQEGPLRDAAIIACTQKIEHYEIASYGILCAFAIALGENQAAELLHETLEEEKDADRRLTEIATASVNLDAIDEPAELGGA